MSFSQDIKKELFPIIPKPRHCLIAELSAFVTILGRIENHCLCIETENGELKRKYFTLLNKTISISECDDVLSEGITKELFETLKIKDFCLDLDGLLIQQSCCKKAFIRGAFLSAGSISDPKKGYHFEIAVSNLNLAKQIQGAIDFFEIDAKIVERKQQYVVYVKESNQIEDLLALMGANIAYLKFENVRIEKEMRNSINRQVNCETANIGKTVSAAYRQLEDIRLIEEKRGLSSLPKNLQEIAILRKEHPDMALKDLGNLLDPPVGKSGVNHRLRRIGEIAKSIRT
ncbi:MAG: DNA-binding protein WhiA [Lachnospiraceae bacterium]|nr:DNA-binding protein WhiA [Lachnospiraceae bacterium]